MVYIIELDQILDPTTNCYKKEYWIFFFPCDNISLSFLLFASVFWGFFGDIPLADIINFLIINIY